MSLVLEEHRRYLADSVRLDAFSRAISAVVRPGDRVLDLASGSGILGFLACRAGAARVYAIDNSPAIQLGRDLASANGLGDRITFLREFSTRAILPEPADVLVFDQLGPMGYEAGVFEFGRDARQRLLAPGARIIPSAVDLSFAAVESSVLRQQVAFWSEPGRDFDLSSIGPLAANTVYTSEGGDLRRLSDAGVAASLDIGGDATHIQAALTLSLREPGRLDALCGWFTAHLAPGVTMTNAPDAAARIDRRVGLLPIEPAVPVRTGDQLTITLLIRPADEQIAWSGEVRRDGQAVATFRHSSFQGEIIPDEARQAADPATRPRLSALGEAHRTVLQMCDGTVPVADIERAILERHASALGSPAAAAAFVHEAINANCR